MKKPKYKETDSIFRYHKELLKYKDMKIAILMKFYNATLDALSLQSKGHTNGWAKVQKIIDKIEDNYNLED
jgi:hypothetical protein